jgi:hyperosmotically inducible protein
VILWSENCNLAIGGKAKMKKTLIAIAASLALWGPLAPAQTYRGSANREMRADQRIAREVRHELVMLPYYGVFDNLSFRVDGDRVTLLGQVTRPTLKHDAEAAIKDVEGVRSISNEIEVLPLSPDDDRIRLATYRAIFGQVGLDRYAMQAVPPIHIIVKNGTVTLEGVVANENDRNMAGIRANGVHGAFKVVNNLRVEGKA